MGCACKVSPAILESILKEFPTIHHPDILVDSTTSDDAAVYRINESQAIVQTVDFFTPVVDDPFDFGAISAANSLSDIYAMGASPLFALNVVAFPSNRLPAEVLRQILEGARSVTDEAGIHILGGHTIEDNEPKFGLVVSGLIHPDRIKRNSTARIGDHLILTKALGTGVMCTALKRGMLEKETEKNLIAHMRQLNRKASELMVRYRVSACTDITGFGLTGHLKEMVESSGTGAEINAPAVPVLKGALDLANLGFVPGGTRNNMKFAGSVVKFMKRISDGLQVMLSDAQTSGGLLISIDPAESNAFLKEFNSPGIYEASVIGKITGNKGRIFIYG
jgi:selenium donor protein